MSSKNPCAKTMKPEQAYEVWQSYDGSWTYYVLKKYQSSEKEAQNPYARWYCRVTSPLTTERGDYGDHRNEAGNPARYHQPPFSKRL